MYDISGELHISSLNELGPRTALVSPQKTMARQPISAADRIRELSAINAEVAAMLQSAGHAIDSLTNRPLNHKADGDEDTEMADNDQKANLDARKAAFTQHTEAYYTGLQSIVARLRRQAYALEEAGIIAAEAPALASSSHQKQNVSKMGAGGAQAAGPPMPEPERLTNGGLGNLDVGWLNSRGNKVGSEKENELVDEARKLLEEVLSRNPGAS